ncbi:MAG: phosphoribosylamine--glycine ligase [Alphaproteobacteria bacterium]|nr:phosphoribosylamine--glycine ligase [Alphaproteobacteria bacterium]
MKVLVIGSGGREHAICWSLGASSLIDQLYCAPGSAAIAEEATLVPLKVDDIDGIVGFCRERKIDLVFPGPELPLVLGIADRLDEAGIKCFGPSAAAAKLEGSKAFMKAFAARHRIPSAAHAVFSRDQADEAKAYIALQGAPIVIKADGLAAGKGVTVASTVEEAKAAVDAAFDGAFGDAGDSLVIEECLVGEEASFFALVDGQNVLASGTAQDHKAVGEGDKGPNTGGMGAYSPAPCMTDDLIARTMDEIIRPTVEGMAAEGTPYRGVLYAGLMLTEAGPKLIEYNVRFGDPECQVLMPRLMSDFLPVILAGAEGSLDQVDLRWRPVHSMTVVMAAKGYPGSYEKGSEIGGLAAASEIEGVTIFHAGTRIDGDRLLAAGGRVLNVTAEGETLAEARDRAYQAVDCIDWPNGFCRRDIGWRALGGPA